MTDYEPHELRGCVAPERRAVGEDGNPVPIKEPVIPRPSADAVPYVLGCGQIMWMPRPKAQGE